MRSSFVSVLAALALLCAPLVGGCAAALPIITTVASVITEVAGWLDLIESQASTSDALTPELKARLKALRAAVQRISDAARLSPAAYAVAVQEFERLWADLLVVVGPLGVRTAAPDGRLSASPTGGVQVPPAAELGARLREAGTR